MSKKKLPAAPVDEKTGEGQNKVGRTKYDALLEFAKYLVEKIERHPFFAIATIFVFAPVGLVVAVTLTPDNRIAIPVGQTRWVISVDRNVAVQSIHGVFGAVDIVSRTQMYFSTEVLRLTVDGRDEHSLKGVALGTVRLQDGSSKELSWHIKGFSTTNNLVMTYLTDEPNPWGVGAYILRRFGDDYVGKIIHVHADKVIVCPYAASSKGSLAVDQWQKRWPLHFGKQCESFEIFPDFSTGN